MLNFKTVKLKPKI